MAKCSGLLFTLLFSQTAWIVLFAVGKALNMLDQTIILSVGVVALACLSFLVWKCQSTPDTKQFNEQLGLQLVYWISTGWAWTCIVDLILYLEAIGYISNVMGFYYKYGEPYLEYSNGKAMNIWDATAHYVLYLTMVYLIQNGRKAWRSVCLFYCGSMTTGMILLTFGTASGSFGDQIHLAMILNIPFFIIPFYCLNYAFFKVPTKQGKRELKRSILFPPLVILIVACIAFSSIRAIAAFDSPHPLMKQYNKFEPYLTNPENYGKFTAIINFFYGVPILVIALKNIVRNTTTATFKNIALVYAGSVSQTTFLQLYSQFDSTMEQRYKPTTENASLVISLNLMLPLCAYFLCYYLRNSSEAPNKTE